MKKALRERQTLRTGCSKAEPKIFAPLQTPFPGAQDGQNLISWRWSLPLPTNPVWWGSMHAISNYRGNRPTNTNLQTGPITVHLPLSLVHSVINDSLWLQSTLPRWDETSHLVFLAMWNDLKMKTSQMHWHDRHVYRTGYDQLATDCFSTLLWRQSNFVGHNLATIIIPRTIFTLHAS